MCEKCNIELVSKAGLKRHTEKCQAKSTSSPGNPVDSTEECTNGPECRFFRQNRCLYYHDEPSEEPWQRVQPRRQGRQGRQQTQTRQQVHPRQQLQSRRQLPAQQRARTREELPRQQLQECRNGQGCIYWKHDRCNFSHSGQKHKGLGSRQQHQGLGSRQQHQSLDSRQQHQGKDSRQQRKDLDSRQQRQGQDMDTNQGKPCKFGAKCDRILSCGFLHFVKDFLSVRGQRRN